MLSLAWFGAAWAETIAVEVNKGRVLRLPRAAATVFVADPAIADVQVKSPTLIYLYGKTIGETTLIAADGDEVLMLDAPVTVSHNLARLGDALSELMPGTPLQVSTVGNAVVLEGTVASPRQAEDARRLAAVIAGGDDFVINRLSVSAPTQVNLRVRVAEMSRDVSKNLGFSLDATAAFGNFALGLLTANPFAGAVSSGVIASFSGGGLDVNGIIDAMEGSRLVRILAEPNLTALSGETASFLAGGEFPIVYPGDEDGTSVVFKQFGVSLAFTPTVLDDGRINLHVRPEVSQLSSQGAVDVGGFSIPALTTRRAETTVELASGQSFAIAGLLRQEGDENLSKFPGLGDLPVLGTLFRSTAFQRTETELVIIVTPYTVAPVSERLLASPVDGLLPPHDVERIMFGAQWRREHPRTAASALSGPVGFLLH
jgi:pilus assembly protein CpaC